MVRLMIHPSRRRDRRTPDPPALLVSVATVAKMLDLSRTSVFGLLASGRFGPEPLRLSRRALRFRRDEVERWVLAGLPSRTRWVEMVQGRQ